MMHYSNGLSKSCACLANLLHALLRNLSTILKAFGILAAELDGPVQLVQQLRHGVILSLANTLNKL